MLYAARWKKITVDQSKSWKIDCIDCSVFSGPPGILRDWRLETTTCKNISLFILYSSDIFNSSPSHVSWRSASIPILFSLQVLLSIKIFRKMISIFKKSRCYNLWLKKTSENCIFQEYQIHVTHYDVISDKGGKDGDRKKMRREEMRRWGNEKRRKRRERRETWEKKIR